MDLNEYEVLLDRLDIEIQKIKPNILEKTNIYRDKLFSIYPQFKDDYLFFYKDSEDKPQIICETKYGLVWTSTEGALAHYFKLLNSINFIDNIAKIEKIFRVYNLKKKSEKPSTEWNEIEKYRKNVSDVKNIDKLLIQSRSC